MGKKLLLLLLLCAALTSTLVACGGSNNSSSTPEKGTVHMSGNDFVQSSVTISKGDTLTLVVDDFTPHFIANGTWEQGSAKPSKEPGAPAINNVEINGNASKTFGPFNSTGTFQLYCTIHAGMNLTVIVQ